MQFQKVPMPLLSNCQKCYEIVREVGQPHTNSGALAAEYQREHVAP